MLLGPSPRSAFMVDGTEEGKNAVEYVRRIFDEFRHCEGLADAVPDLDTMVKRHCFSHIADLQIALLLAEAGYTLTPEVTNFFANVNSRLMASQIDEDAFNVQKNMPRYKNRQGSVERAWKTLVDAKIISGRHLFSEVRHACTPDVRDACVAHSAFATKPSQVPKQLRKIASYQQRVSYPSPRGEAWTVPTRSESLLKNKGLKKTPLPNRKTKHRV